MLVDPNNPFFDALWVRLLCVILPLAWAGVELYSGAHVWAGLFAAEVLPVQLEGERLAAAPGAAGGEDPLPSERGAGPPGGGAGRPRVLRTLYSTSPAACSRCH